MSRNKVLLARRRRLSRRRAWDRERAVRFYLEPTRAALEDAFRFHFDDSFLRDVVEATLG